MKASFENSNLPSKYWYPFALKNVPKDSQANTQLEDIRKNLTNFVQKGKSLLMQSENCGNGKTSWGIKLLQKQIELNCNNCVDGYPQSYFVYTPELLLEARQSISHKTNSFIEKQNIINNCPLVMFDDIACIPLKDYDLLILSTLIEARILRGLSNIYTTNLKEESLRSCLGERLYDRIIGLSEVVTFNSKSLRGR
jgi:DNA replication protein DnaC